MLELQGLKLYKGGTTKVSFLHQRITVQARNTSSVTERDGSFVLNTQVTMRGVPRNCFRHAADLTHFDSLWSASSIMGF